MFAVFASRARLDAIHNSFPKDSLERYHLKHVFHATWEGQHAAMRWLIEFAGIKAQKNSNIVTIECFKGGELITQHHEKYKELLEVWALCSEVTSHPTMRKRKSPDEDPNPIRLAEDRCHEAARVLHTHFKKIYEVAGEVC